MSVNAIFEDHTECIYNTATISDSNTPNEIEAALKGSDKKEWRRSAESEIENFQKIGSWEMVSREDAKIEGRKIIPCKWVFKIKHELNDTTKYKTRLFVKRFHQIPGENYTKLFSSTLFHTEDKGWTCEMFDVEAAFLNAELEIPMYLEWSETMRE